jgi:hypothetical protein
MIICYKYNLTYLFIDSSLAILVIAAMAAINVSVNSQDKALSDVSLSNVEALANENPDCPNGCPDQAGSGCWCYTYYPYVKEATWN